MIWSMFGSSEHLEAEHAETIVDTIVKHGDVIVFPILLTEEDHKNEQPFEYWRDIFAKHGYDQYDFVRPFIRGNSLWSTGIDTTLLFL